MSAPVPTYAWIRFEGWATIRLPTDPDPADEPRGASGYTFAFAGEPDLDRIIRLQPEEDPSLLRPGSPWPWGVTVSQVLVSDGLGGGTPLPELVGAKVRLLGGPKLENRNWLFTLPGWEPIVPFDLAIGDAPQQVRRRARLTDDQDGDPPVYKIPTAALMAQGATGANLERETLGTATGIWDSYAVVLQRITTVKQLLAREKDPVKQVCLQARLRELAYAQANPYDRRVMARYGVERFTVTLADTGAVVPSSGKLAGLDTSSPWTASFFLTGFDPDLLAMYVQGCLQAPFKPAGGD